MTQKFKFAEGERVLCFHGPLIYEAKALKCSVKDKQIKYYIHYAGWNKNWDEWVPEDRVLKYNDVNVQRQKEVFKQHNTAHGKSKKVLLKGKKGEAVGGGPSQKESGASSGGSESRASTPSKEINNISVLGAGRGRGSKQVSSTLLTSKDADTSLIASKKEENKDDSISSLTLSTKLDEKEDPIKKKRVSTSNQNEKPSSNTSNPSPTPPATTNSSSASTPAHNDSNQEQDDNFVSKMEVKIKIPDELKQCLADDWDAITRQHKLLDIPAKITIQDIVDQYIAYKKASKSSSNSKELAVTDIMNGIVEYFNVMIGSQLLYKFERPQYADILQQYSDTPLSKLYGGFHLLRLFVKLGSMLGYSALDEKSMQMLLSQLNDFLKFLVKNSATYFNMMNFVNVSPEYVRNTQ